MVAMQTGHGTPVTLYNTADTEIGTAATPLATTATLAASSAVIGHVITDAGSVVAGTGTAGTAATGVVTIQGIASMTPVSVSSGASTTGGYSFLNIPAGQATTTVKSGAGTLHTIVLNSAATATNTTIIYDNTAASGTVIGRPAVVTATIPVTLTYDLAFSTGITIITATANGGDMTVTYK